MNKKTRFNNVFCELKAAVGSNASFRTLVDSTQALIDIFDDETVDRRIAYEGPETLDQRSIFEIWESDPWTLYYNEPMDNQCPESDGFQLKTLLGC